MTSRTLELAALASAAVPGLTPTGVQQARQRAGHDFEVAFVDDDQQRRWVVRAPLTSVAAARLEQSVALLGLLHRRVPFAVPQARGFAAVKGVGRAVVYPYLPGRPVSLADLPPGPGVAADLGRAIGALHNVDRQLFEEAGVASYDAESYRQRRLAEVDRAAATGHVPTALLSRWESRLEDVTAWRFAATPTHGDVDGDRVLAVFEDEQDASTGRVRGLLGWEDAKVADPADDFAQLIASCSPDTFDAVLEAYAHSRAERLDSHLEVRARLAGELRLVTRLLAAVGMQDQELVTECAEQLRELDERTAAEDEEHERAVAARPARQSPSTPAVPRAADVPPAAAAGSEIAGSETGGSETGGTAGSTNRSASEVAPTESLTVPGSDGPAVEGADKSEADPGDTTDHQGDLTAPGADDADDDTMDEVRDAPAPAGTDDLGPVHVVEPGPATADDSAPGAGRDELSTDTGAETADADDGATAEQTSGAGRDRSAGRTR